MPITVKDWKNQPDETTPLSAEALEDLETRMGAYADAAVAAGGGTSANASTTVKGIAKITPAPATATDPIAVGSNHTALTDVRTPTDLSVTNAKVATGAAIAESKLALASDAIAGTASRRSLGTGATQAAAGNHTHSTLAPLASPAFTGVPTAPTAVVGTNTTQIATTAFVQASAPAVFSVQDEGTLVSDVGQGATFDVLDEGTLIEAVG
jgi:hypothetical protein